MGYAERVADDNDPLRYLIRGAIRANVPPSIFIRHDPAISRTVETPWWTDRDSLLIMALEDYESGLCPGCNNPKDETTKPEHADAYRPGERRRCHYCTADALLSETLQNEKHSAGVLVSLVLDPEVVELNRQPVPPLPPELGAFADPT